jgi:predicted nucleic acid-binding protein
LQQTKLAASRTEKRQAAYIIKGMRIYLDMCALKRAYDDPSSDRVVLETLAVASIISASERGAVTLVSSAALELENSKNPLEHRRQEVGDVLGTMEIIVAVDEDFFMRAREIGGMGLRPLDSLHIASAERGGCDYMVTCDDKCLRAARRAQDRLLVKVVSPLEVEMPRMEEETP